MARTKFRIVHAQCRYADRCDIGRIDGAEWELEGEVRRQRLAAGVVWQAAQSAALVRYSPRARRGVPTRPNSACGNGSRDGGASRRGLRRLLRTSRRSRARPKSGGDSYVLTCRDSFDRGGGRAAPTPMMAAVTTGGWFSLPFRPEGPVDRQPAQAHARCEAKIAFPSAGAAEAVPTSPRPPGLSPLGITERTSKREPRRCRIWR
jgi:hypothetical protein